MASDHHSVGALWEVWGLIPTRVTFFKSFRYGKQLLNFLWLALDGLPHPCLRPGSPSPRTEAGEICGSALEMP